MKQRKPPLPEPRFRADAAIYLYCLTPPPGPTRIESENVDRRHQVTALQVKDVVAVVGCVSLDEFAGATGEANLQDPSWVIPRACQHERVVEEVMACSPVLPVRFGTVFSSARVLRQRLARHAEEVSRFLEDISNKQEWAVKGFLDAERAVDWWLTSDAELASRRQGMPESPGARYLQEKQLRAEARRRLTTWQRELGDELQGALTGADAEVCPLRPQPKGVSGREADMVFNCAFLLAGSRVPDFRARVERHAARYAERGLTLEVSGPWPPYSFCPAIPGAG